MTAYSITEVEVLDRDGAARYAELTGAAVATYGGRFLVLAAEPTLAEGDAPDEQRIVLIEFPTMSRLEAWYDSPEYAPARDIAATALRRRLRFVPGVEGTPPVPVAPDDPEQTVRRFYEAMSTGDPTAGEELLAPDWQDIPLMPGTPPGPAGFAQVVTYLRSVFPDLQVTVEDVVVSGEQVAVRSLVRGTHRADFLGVAATQRQVQFRAFDFHQLQDGRITRSWHLEDYLDALQQLGARVGAQVSAAAVDAGSARDN